MKKFCLLIFAVALCLSSYAQYVDLRLPSGTKWKSSNETGFYTYEKAVNTFGDKLPTKKQCEELKDKCKLYRPGEIILSFGLFHDHIR